MALTYTPQDELGTPCPDFNLLGVDGKTYALKDFQTGGPLLVMFICNHCPYVKAVEDRLIALAKDLDAIGVSTVGICSNDAENYPEDNYVNLQKRAREKNYTFVYLHDPHQEAAQTFGAVCTPDFFLYDKSLKLAYRGRLDDSWKDPSRVTRRELFEAAKKLAAGQTLTEKQIPSMGCNIKWIER